ncbi:secreted phosphoprotein 24 [Myxocyprinus asiaticus]|uniref:secreted phosphoprotein 24 n=1 Tax=Myxocyprinus asiaticus TaxID=70543 RepID=UPI002222B12A|nr:secreted phosphoprotein 24 [Myxocyprinus asiaticus]
MWHDEVNRQSSNFNLYRANNRVVRQITLVGDNTYDILLDFGIKDTVCLKYHRRTYTDGCIFKQRPFTSMELCSSLVRVGSGLAAPLGISCVAATDALGSSSESSSEESIVRGQNRPNGALSL